MKRSLICICVLVCLLIPVIFGQSTERSETPERDKWDLTDLYQTDEAWIKAKKHLLAQIDEISSFKDRLAESSKNLIDCLALTTKIERDMRRLDSYSYNKYNQDTRKKKYQRFRQETTQLSKIYNVNSAFIEPEILKIDESIIRRFINNEPELKSYEFYLNDLFRRKERMLSEKEERVIAETRMMTNTPSSVYNTFFNTEFDGKLENYQNTFGALMYAKIIVDVFLSRVRGFGDCLEMALYPDNVPVEIYHKLIENAKNNLGVFHRYLRIKKKLLNTETLKISDLSNSSLQDLRMEYDLENAKKMIKKALKPLGNKYLSVVQRAFQNQWIDMYPFPGKRSGAYCDFGAYREHPYILMNFSGRYEHLSIMIAELGHAVHTFYADRNQPFPKAFYSFFIAEIPSFCNEVLLKKDVFEEIKNDHERMNFLLNNLDISFFKRAMISEFELKIHREVENNNVLTGDSIGKIYLNILRKYYGHDQGICLVPDSKKMDWASDRLLFIRNYYIFRYATSQIAAIVLANKIYNGDKDLLEKYFYFLSSGGSDYPVKLLEGMGIDLASDGIYNEAMISINGELDEIESIIIKRGIAK